MSKYIEKPVEIEAFQVPELKLKKGEKPSPKTQITVNGAAFSGGCDSQGVFIKVGNKPARQGNWIVTHSHGLIEVLDDKEFNQAYISAPTPAH